MKYIPYIFLVTALILAGVTATLAQESESLEDEEVTEEKPVEYNISIIEHGTSAVGRIYEFTIIDSIGNLINCIVLEDKLSCYNAEITNPIIPINVIPR